MTTALISLVSVIVGILLSHSLTRSGQKTQWILEQRKLEGRELIGAITEHYDAIMFHLAPSILKNIPVKAEDQTQLNDARRRALRTLSDRIYLASDVKQGKLSKRWVDAFNAFKDNKESEGVTAFVREYEAICDFIVKAGTKGS